MSRYWIDLLLEYRRTRLPHVVYVPLAAFLAAAAYSGATPDVLGLVAAAALCYGLVLQFRLWDDLADVDEDRLRAPNRVLCRPGSTSDANRALVVLSAVVLLLVLYRNTWGAGSWLYVLLLALASLWYGTGARRNMSVAARSRIQLCKYPLFALIVAPPAWSSNMPWLAISMLLVYLSFIIFEFLDDDRIAAGRHAGTELGVYLLLVSILWFLPLTDPAAGRILPRYAFAALMVAGVVLLIVLYRKRFGGRRPATLHYSVFVPTFVSVVYSSTPGPS